MLAVSLIVLLGGSLLAPDSVQTWADTQPEGWRRTIATAWSEPVGRLSRSLSLDRPRQMAADALDTSPTPTTLPPAVRPDRTATSTPTSTPTTTADVGASERPTTTAVNATSTADVGVAERPTTTAGTSPTTADVEASESPTSTAGTSSTTAPPLLSTPTTVAPRTATAGDPLRILAVGDSLMLDLQYGLERVLGRRDDVAITGRGALGFGFTVPHWDWDEDVLTDYALSVAEARPEVIVMMIGANEFEGYVIEGEALPPGTERWREVLAERADEAVAHWLAGGGHVYWWTTPAMRDERFAAVAELNDVWHDTMAAWAPAGSMLDSMEVLGDEAGNYRDEIAEDDGSVVPLRKEHGVHFFEVGADLLAAQLERELVADGWLTPR